MILIWIVSWLVVSVILSLYSVEWHIIVYVWMINSLLLSFYGLWWWVRKQQKYHEIARFQRPSHPNRIDYAYQLWIDDLKEQMADLSLESRQNQSHLSEVVTSSAHSMKVPLAALRLLSEQTEADPALKPSLRRLELELDRLLNFVKFSQEQVDFYYSQVALAPMINRLISQNRLFFQQKGLSIQVKGQASWISDEKWLSFVCEQILDNAIKYTMKGGIDVHLSNEKIVISDTGMGILPEDIPRLFEAGFTGYNGRLSKRATGLGLSMAHQVAQKLNLTIEITSVLSKGTRVEIKR